MDLLDRNEGLTAAGLPSYSRFTLMELLPRLESANPTAAPATSAQLDGEWALRYAGGPAPGLVNSPTREIALLLYAGARTSTLQHFNTSTSNDRSPIGPTRRARARQRATQLTLCSHRSLERSSCCAGRRARVPHSCNVARRRAACAWFEAPRPRLLPLSAQAASARASSASACSTACPRTWGRFRRGLGPPLRHA